MVRIGFYALSCSGGPVRICVPDLFSGSVIQVVIDVAQVRGGIQRQFTAGAERELVKVFCIFICEQSPVSCPDGDIVCGGNGIVCSFTCFRKAFLRAFKGDGEIVVAVVGLSIPFHHQVINLKLLHTGSVSQIYSQHSHN